jgi:hypothetical protein
VCNIFSTVGHAFFNTPVPNFRSIKNNNFPGFFSLRGTLSLTFHSLSILDTPVPNCRKLKKNIILPGLSLQESLFYS